MPQNLGSSAGWLGRIQGSIKGIGFGFVIFVIGFPLLFWNEGRAVKTAKSLAEGAASVVSISADTVDANNEQKLVHVSGSAEPTGTLVDEIFGIQADAIQLKRTVEMYQWQEIEEQESSADSNQEPKYTYRYEKVWSDQWIDSSEFRDPVGHQNPQQLPFQSHDFVADKVAFGKFQLTPDQVLRIPGEESLAFDSTVMESLSPGFKERVTVSGDHLLLPAAHLAAIDLAGKGETENSAASESEPTDAESSTSSAEPNHNEAKAKQDAEVDELIQGVNDSDTTDPSVERSLDEQGNSSTNTPSGSQEESSSPAESSDDSMNPAVANSIGDVRIKYSVINPGTLSIIARQTGNSFAPYPTKAGRDLDMLRRGTQSAEQMFQDAVSANNTMTWIIRVVGFVVMAFGVFLVLRPLAVVADMLPLVGGILQLGVGIIAVLIAAPFTLGTIGIAWIFYRPLLGISLLLLGLAFVVVIVFLAKSLATQNRQRDEISQINVS